jgi:hypothetical protein
MEKQYLLTGRWGEQHSLNEVSPNNYTLKTDYNYRVGYKTDSKVDPFMIDPSGGPYMTIGTPIAKGITIKNIKFDSELNDYVFELNESNS